MGSTDKINIADARLGGLLGQYLRQPSRSDSSRDLSDHLDEDTLTAFTEGNLTVREGGPVVGHLADCSFCRHKTADLVRLDLAFADTEVVYAGAESREPAKVSEVLSGILARLFGSGESAVFAHEETEEPDNRKEAEKKNDGD
jgi:hypothetical protein